MPTLRHSTNNPPHSDAPTTGQTGKRSTAASVPRQRAPCHTVRCHLVSVAPLLNAQFTLCYAMSPPFQEATNANVSVVVIHSPTVGVHLSMTGILQYRPSAKLITQIAVFLSFSKYVEKSPLDQRHQPPNLSFRCPHSLCNDVGGQHSMRKPRRGA